jgi:integrase
MGVYARTDSPFWWYLIEGTDRRGSTGVPRRGGSPQQEKELRRQAEEVYAALKADQARGLVHLPVKGSSLLFSAFADWYEVHRVRKMRGREREETILTTLRSAFGSIELAALSRQKIEEWMTHRAKHVNPRTVNREVGTLKSILKAAAALGHLPASPIAGMPFLKYRQPKKRTLLPEEEERLLKYLWPEDRAILLMGLDSLMRLSDILDLKRSDDHGTYLYIADPKDPGQTEPYRVPVSTRLRAALDAIPKTGFYYFPSRRKATTERDRRGAIRLMMKRACAVLDIPYGRNTGGITFHWATRRTGATRMLSRGASLKAVQRIGNWKRPETVLAIYAESLTEDEYKAVELVSKKVAG